MSETNPVPPGQPNQPNQPGIMLIPIAPPGSNIVPAEGFGGKFMVTKSGSITDKDLAATFVVRVEEQIRLAMAAARRQHQELASNLDKLGKARRRFLETHLPLLCPYLDPTNKSAYNEVTHEDRPWSYDTLRVFTRALDLARLVDDAYVPTFGDLSYDPKSKRVAGNISVHLDRQSRGDLTPKANPTGDISISASLTYRGPAPEEFLRIEKEIEETTTELENVNRAISRLRNSLGNVDFLERQARSHIVQNALAKDEEGKAVLEGLDDPSRIENALRYLEAI